MLSHLRHYCRYLLDQEGIMGEFEGRQDMGRPDDEIIMEKLVAHPVHVLKLILAALSFTDDCIPFIQTFGCKLKKTLCY